MWVRVPPPALKVGLDSAKSYARRVPPPAQMKAVLITGATSGIGYEFAKIFASKNHNLLLIARNTKDLKRVHNELTSKSNKVHTYSVDLCHNSIRYFWCNFEVITAIICSGTNLEPWTRILFTVPWMATTLPLISAL